MTLILKQSIIIVSSGVKNICSIHGQLHRDDFWTRDGDNPITRILNKYLEMKNDKIEYIMDMSLDVIDIGYSDLL